MNGLIPQWIAVLWPILLAILVLATGLGGCLVKLSSLTTQVAVLSGLANEHGLRLASGEQQLTGLERTMERIEGKLDRVIERRPL